VVLKGSARDPLLHARQHDVVIHAPPPRSNAPRAISAMILPFVAAVWSAWNTAWNIYDTRHRGDPT
jgi:hypothetical protein